MITSEPGQRTFTVDGHLSMDETAFDFMKDLFDEEPGETRRYFRAREQFERCLVQLTVSRCDGDKRAAAALLGVSYSTIKEKSRPLEGETKKKVRVTVIIACQELP